MVVDISTSTVIERPRDEVALYAADPGNAPAWYANIRSADWVTEPPLVVGSQIRFTARFLGRDLAYTYEVITFEPKGALVMRTVQGPFLMETTYTWEDVDGGTRMTLRNRGAPSGFGRLMAPLMGLAMRRAMTKDLARIKGILES